MSNEKTKMECECFISPFYFILVNLLVNFFYLIKNNVTMLHEFWCLFLINQICFIFYYTTLMSCANVYLYKMILNMYIYLFYSVVTVLIQLGWNVGVNPQKYVFLFDVIFHVFLTETELGGRVLKSQFHSHLFSQVLHHFLLVLNVMSVCLSHIYWWNPWDYFKSVAVSEHQEHRRCHAHLPCL